MDKIHEWSIMFDSSNSHLGLVIQRWCDIQNYFMTLQNHSRFISIAKIDIIFQQCIDQKERLYLWVWKA